MKPISFEYDYHVNVPVAIAWELFSHTDKLNQSMGLPPVQYAPSEKKSDIPTLKAQAKMMGLTLRWDEAPFEWVQNRYFAEVRRFDNGPMKEIQMRLELEPAGEEATTIHVRVAIVPRNFLHVLLVRALLGRKIEKDFGKVVAHLHEFVEKKTQTPLPQPKFLFKQMIYDPRVKPILQAFPEYAPLNEKLQLFLKQGFDNEVLGIRPFELADKWGEERRQLLCFMLDCARAGILDLKWMVICPTCKVPTNQHTALKQLNSEMHCDGCRMRYDTEFDRSVEVRFDVNKAIRPAKAQTYCIGNPGGKGNIFAQILLEPHEKKELTLDWPATRWKVIFFGKAEAEFAVKKTASEKELTIKIQKNELALNCAEVGSENLTVQLHNETEKKCLIQFQDDKWRDQAATAALVTSIPRFRDLFSSELLAPGEEIAVRNLAVMFTDLKGSTAFYQKSGDAKAYQLVRSHFAFINAILEKYNGVLVKTIGDAVFAVFFTAVEAVQAAVEIQQQIVPFNQKNQSDFQIKLGIHSGPLIAVNANGRIDYFGSTTNIGSRLEKESLGGDVILTQTIFTDPDTQEYLQTASLQQEEFTTQLRGIATDFHLTRLIP